MSAIIERDNHEAGRQLTNEALAALAKRINENHNAAQTRVAAVREEVEDICSLSISIAKEVEVAHAYLGGPRFKKWWDDQKLPVGYASKYLTLAKTSDRHTLGDKDQLRFIGVLPEADGHNEGTERGKSDAFDWVKPAGKIRAKLTLDSIGKMGSTEREIAWRQLRPLFETLMELKRLTGDQR